MGLLGERLSGRDVAIGIVLSLSLGFGLLFLSLLHVQRAPRRRALLFGNVLAVSPDDARRCSSASASVTLAALAVISRPLLFASLQPELAEAQGRVAPPGVGMLFLAIVALAVAQSIADRRRAAGLHADGRAAGRRAAPRPAASASGVALAAGLALAEAWLGITIAYYTDWPTSFWITLLSALVYLAAAAHSRRRG